MRRMCASPGALGCLLIAAFVVEGPHLAIAQEAERGAPTQPVQDPGNIGGDQWQRLSAAYAHEPRIEELLQVLDEAEDFDPEVPRSRARRGRRSGWLPTLRLGVRRGQALDRSLQIDEERYSTDDDLVLEGSLVMRLDRAFYGPDEVAWVRESRTRTRLREERAMLLIGAYFERRRLQIERDAFGRRDPETRMRIEELTALLNAFTSGAFTRMMRPSAERPVEGGNRDFNGARSRR